MEKRTPLHWRMKRKRHREIAKLQDIIIETLYKILPRSVLHGGTAIWRCYSGNRFSEDIDVYMKKDPKKIEKIFEELRMLGFKIVKKRMKENSLYSILEFNNVEVRFEALFKEVKGIIKEYETYEGILINVYTLLPETLINEKVDAYLKRRKIRDLYDIFFLLRYVKEEERIEQKLAKLLENFKEQIDDKEEIVEYIRRWVR